MAFLTEESPFWPKPFCDLRLATVLAVEQVSVISDLKGGNAETREEHSRNNSAALGQGPGSLRDIHNSIPLSSAETKTLTQVEDGRMTLTFLTSIS